MKTKNEFQEFFRNDLTVHFASLDTLRKSMLRRIFRDTGIFIVALALLFIVCFYINNAVYGVWFDENEANVPLIVATVVTITGFFIYLGAIHKSKEKFRKSYKEQIIKPIIKFIHPSLEYDPDNFIQNHEFARSQIFLENADTYSGDDLVKGQIDKTKIRFSEVHASYTTQSKNQHKETIFDGIFFIADFNKNFKGKYYVLPDSAERIFGKFGQKFQKLATNRGKLVELEDPDFERLFVVYGSDQVEARYILSPALMARMTAMKKDFPDNLYFSFVGSQINVAISQRGEQFEQSLFRTVDNEKQITKFFHLLSSVIGIVEELNLNTRIWSKE